jgi:putative metalloenzyme radical SAM/SPASM domain maturase
MLEGLESLVLSGIGEPLLNPNLVQFIAEARERMGDSGWIGFQTNGVLLYRDRAFALARAGVDKVCLSLDAVSPDTLGHIRGGADIGSLERAMTALCEAREVRPGLQIGIEFVAMRDNLAELSKVIRWGARRGADFMIVTQCLPYDESLVEQASYDPNTDIAVGFFKPWKERAAREGVDIDRYFEILWTYYKSKTEEEWRIYDFIEEMKKAASDRDIFLNIVELLKRDEDWYEQVARIFAAASKVAEEVGLDLTLPEVLPKGERSCEFVENDGMFVSWDGQVHPCYFLWHGYRCFINGREKFVTPKVFGDLSQTAAAEIWNDPAYVEFRRSVAAYDYPFCSDCNLGKCCDYVQAEEFEQDCYINHEPCGDCLWCKGVFNCLQ